MARSDTAAAVKVWFAVAAIGIIWGSNFVFMKWSVALISPAQTVTLRLLFGLLPVLLLAASTGAMNWRHMRHLHHFAVMGLLSTALFYLAFSAGVGMLNSSIAGALSGATPLFTFLIAAIALRHERTGARAVAGVLVGFTGVLFLARPWAGGAGSISLSGVACMLAGCLSLGCAFVYGRRFITPLAIAPAAVTAYQIAIALIAMLPFTDLGDAWSALRTDLRASLALAGGLGLLGTGVATMLYYYILDRTGAVTASATTYLPPVVALAIGRFLEGEPVGGWEVMAIAFTLGGVALVQAGRRPAEAHPAPQRDATQDGRFTGS